MADNINAILAQGIGPSLVEGTHAGYFSGKGNMEAEQEKRRLASQADIPAAMKGDADAFGRVAANDPKGAVAISTALSRMDAGQQAKAKATADYTSRAANAVLQADPKDRPAIYQQMLDIGRQQGHDVSTLPPQYSPQLDPILRSHRAMGVGVQEWFKQQEETKRKQMPGRVNTGTEVWGTPPGPQSALPSSGPALASAAPDAGLPPGVQTAPYLPPAQGVALATPQAPPGGPVAAPAGPAPVAAPPIAAASAGPAGAPQGFQAMGHRDPQGNLVPALIDGKPVYRNPQTGEMKLGDPQMAQGPAAAPESVALSSGAPGDQPPGSALPGGPQLAQATPPGVPAARATPGGTRTSPKIVYEDPAAQGGQIGMFKAPNGKTELIEGPGNTSIYKMPDGSFQAWKPGLVAPGKFEDVKDPSGKLIGQRDKATNQYHPINQTQSATAGIDPDLKGDAVYAALPPARAAEIKSIVNGDNPIPPPNARNQYAQETRQLVFQAAGDGFTDATHKQRMEMKTAMTKGKIGDVLTAQGTLFNHLAELQSTAEDLKNTPYPIINKIGNVIGLNTGDPRVTNMAAVKHRVNEEAEKYFGGSGAVTVSGLSEAQKELNEAQSPEQINGAIQKLTKLIAGRQSELTAQINRGLQYPKDKQLTPDDLLTPEAKASRDKITAGFPQAAPNTVDSKLFGTPGGPTRPPLDTFQK